MYKRQPDILISDPRSIRLVAPSPILPVFVILLSCASNSPPSCGVVSFTIFVLPVIVRLPSASVAVVTDPAPTNLTDSPLLIVRIVESSAAISNMFVRFACKLPAPSSLKIVLPK